MKVLYLHILHTIYQVLEAILLWYRKFRTDLEKIMCEFNVYDLCMENMEIKNIRHIVCFHMDDTLSNHVEPKVITTLRELANKIYDKLE